MRVNAAFASEFNSILRCPASVLLLVTRQIPAARSTSQNREFRTSHFRAVVFTAIYCRIEVSSITAKSLGRVVVAPTDNVPFVVEVDCPVWLPWSVLIDIQKVSMLAIEIRRASASLVCGVPRENVVAQLWLECISSRTRGSGRSTLSLCFPCADQKLQRFPGIGGWRCVGAFCAQRLVAQRKATAMSFLITTLVPSSERRIDASWLRPDLA